MTVTLDTDLLQEKGDLVRSSRTHMSETLTVINVLITPEKFINGFALL